MHSCSSPHVGVLVDGTLLGVKDGGIDGAELVPNNKQGSHEALHVSYTPGSKQVLKIAASLISLHLNQGLPLIRASDNDPNIESEPL